ncbi:rh178.2 [macacine betaherpesvirus 3]|uniref:Rh178.2 n=1 Tax=Rhesus cytomegalovirus (strain 68-1) TaxID=47929 RepID=Q2FAC3_RHCM6|nr:rh178.2 [macacine betaherpesvirus 3]
MLHSPLRMPSGFGPNMFASKTPSLRDGRVTGPPRSRCVRITCAAHLHLPVHAYTCCLSAPVFPCFARTHFLFRSLGLTDDYSSHASSRPCPPVLINFAPASILLAY